MRAEHQVAMTRVLTSAAAYFGLVFGAGFVLGTVRVLWIVPRIGTRAAELVESPLMLLVTIIAAAWINRRILAASSQAARLQVGLIALALLLAAEVGLGVILRGAPPLEILTDKDPVSGTVYYGLLGVFAAMPWLLAHFAPSARRA
jgi:hypothetical protein